jgi:hypothetical protein
LAAEGGRVVFRGPQGTLVANFADGADAASSAAGSAASPVAFQMRLTPQAPSGGSGTPAPGSATPAGTASEASLEVAAAGIAPQAEASEDLSWRASGAEPDGGQGEPPAGQKQRPASGLEKAGGVMPPDARKPTAASLTASPAAAPGAPSATATPGAPMDAPARTENRPDAAAPRAPETADRTADARPAPETPKPSTPARDMQFAVGGGDRRVEVRVAERGGEVRVAVRTPDQNLAGSLRDDLPALTARLEAAGLRAETWHAGSSGGARERLVETSSRTLSQDSREQPGQDGSRQRDDAPPQGAKQPADSSNPKRDKKDFQWLLTSLR